MKRIKVLLVVLGISVLGSTLYYVSLPLGKFLFELKSIYTLDNTHIENSKYIGSVVSVAPISALVMEKNDKNDWRDKYYYLYANYFKDMNEFKFKRISIKPLEGYSDFEVIDVRMQARISGKYTICFLRNIKNHAIVVTEECDNLASINSFTSFYKLVEIEMNTHGSFYFTADPGWKTKPHIFKINRVETYKVNSIDEMFNILIDHDYGGLYSSLYFRRPYFMKFRENFHENEFYKFYRPKDFTAASPLDRTDWARILKENELPKDVLGQILTLFPTSLINRWVLINMFLLNKDGILSKPIVSCLSKHLEGSQDLIEENEKVFKFIGTLGKAMKLESNDTANVCSWLSLPTLSGEGKIIPMSFE